MTTADWWPRQVRCGDDQDLQQMDKFERKKIVDEFNGFIDKLDDNLSEEEDDRIREELDRIWYKELDPIAEIQVDPLRADHATEIEILDKKAIDEGATVRFTAQLHHLELDEWDTLDSVLPWSRLDLCDPLLYDKLASFWKFDRLQDMDFHDKFWIPKRIMES
jgi:hypothetical protein